jgi:hypothetical protein
MRMITICNYTQLRDRFKRIYWDNKHPELDLQHKSYGLKNNLSY